MYARMKLAFTSEDSLAVLQRVRWQPYVEVLYDDEMLMCTPHKDIEPQLHQLYTSSRLVQTADPMSPYVQVIDIKVDEEAVEDRELLRNITVLLILRGIVDDDVTQTIEWASELLEDAPEHIGFEQGYEPNEVTLKMETEGYCVVRSVFSKSFPRRWKGVQIRMNAIGVQRAISELLVA